MVTIKRIARQVIQRWGYRISRSRQLDLDEAPTYAHPLQAIYANHENDLAILHADLCKCINYTGQTYGKTGWHPFVAALKEFKDGRDTYDGSCLQAYYKTWKPENAQEAFLTFSNAPAEFRKQPSFGFVSPWHNLSLEARKRAMRFNVYSENKSNGNKPLGIDHGFGLHGPVTHEKGRIEFERLTETYKSIREKGYIVNHSDDLIVGFSLVDTASGDYRIIVVHGNHRLAALTTLDYTEIPVKLVAPFVVRRDEVVHWPNVRSEIWNIQNAQQYFDSCFATSGAMKKWAETKGLFFY